MHLCIRVVRSFVRLARRSIDRTRTPPSRICSSVSPPSSRLLSLSARDDVTRRRRRGRVPFEPRGTRASSYASHAVVSVGSGRVDRWIGSIRSMDRVDSSRSMHRGPSVRPSVRPSSIGRSVRLIGQSIDTIDRWIPVFCLRSMRHTRTDRDDPYQTIRSIPDDRSIETNPTVIDRRAIDRSNRIRIRIRI